MEVKRSKKWDDNITVTRVLLLLSIIAAHSSITRNEATSSLLVWRIWQVVSIVGVPGFLILSGYLYKGKPSLFKSLWKKKIQSVILPWAVCGTLIYFVTQIGNYSALGYFKFMIGHGSFLYYMTILVVCFLLFYIIYDNEPVLWACVGITCLSLLFTQVGIYKALFTNFLNIANWIGYFAVGCLIRKHKILEKVKTSGICFRLFLALAGVAIIIIGVLFKIETYFYLGAFPSGCVCLLGSYALCSLLRLENSKQLQNIGKWSFSIYLLHMPFVAALKRVVRAVNPELYIMIPVMIVILFWFIFTIIERIGKDSSVIVRRITSLIGMR